VYCFGGLFNEYSPERNEVNVHNVVRYAFRKDLLVRIMHDNTMSIEDVNYSTGDSCWLNYLKEKTLDHFYVRDARTNILRQSPTLIPIEGTTWVPGFIPSTGVEALYRRKEKSGVVLEKDKKGINNSINACITYYYFIIIFAYFIIN